MNACFKYFVLYVFFVLIMPEAFSADTAHPCHGGLLSIIDRPTYGNSACPAPTGQGILEQGIQVQSLIETGIGINYPQAELRLGLPRETEVTVFFPLYNQQTVYPYTGLEATVFGLKHIIISTQDTVFTGQALIIPPSGSDALGSRGTGGKFQGILSHGFASNWNITVIASLNTQTAPILADGVRYNSVFLDGVLAWAWDNKIQWYIESYAQTQNARFTGLGINLNTGFVFVLRPNITFDIEVGQRLYGDFGYFERYIGSGVVIQF